jgi:hypothetical protein
MWQQSSLYSAAIPFTVGQLVDCVGLNVPCTVGLSVDCVGLNVPCIIGLSVDCVWLKVPCTVGLSVDCVGLNVPCTVGLSVDCVGLYVDCVGLNIPCTGGLCMCVDSAWLIDQRSVQQRYPQPWAVSIQMMPHLVFCVQGQPACRHKEHVGHPVGTKGFSPKLQSSAFVTM